MEIKYHSGFKDPAQDKQWFEDWVNRLEKHNRKTYQRIDIATNLGTTCVWCLPTEKTGAQTLVIFPGARTSALFWDFDNNLSNLGGNLLIYLVETNGLPNLSDGDTPDIHATGYGVWAAEVMNKLNIEKAYVAGASFGGLVAMKQCLLHPEKVKAAFLLNPGCLQPFSLSIKNLYYNILPIVSPTRKNVLKFLHAAVFCSPHHQLSAEAESLIVDYEVFALTRYRDNTQKPYYMNDELSQVSVDTYLLVGDHDLLFPYERSVANAHAKIPSLKDVIVFNHVGHGIETFPAAMRAMAQRMQSY